VKVQKVNVDLGPSDSENKVVKKVDVKRFESKDVVQKLSASTSELRKNVEAFYKARDKMLKK
jgi:hypothetical protein